MNVSLALESLAALLQYPKEDYQRLVEVCRLSIVEEDIAATQDGPGVGGHFLAFADGVRPLTATELEELYTRTFDLNPTCALDIGWHLYGEQYARGTFLVTLRDALRNHGIEENTELPDHLPSVLRLLARSKEQDAVDLAERSLRPAIAKMLTAFPDGQNPFSSLLRTVEGLLNVVSPPVSEGERT